MLISYREYLGKPSYDNFDSFNEMAEERQVIRRPVMFDKDDIEFLNQFDYNDWGQALYQRYNLLFKEVQRMHKIKDAREFRELIRGISNFLQDRSDENRRELMNLQEPFAMSKEEIDEINDLYPPDVISTMENHDIEVLAEKGAHDHYMKHNESNVEMVNDPKVHEFVFKNISFEPREGQPARQIGGQRSASDKIVRANPFIRRLYHKLERSIGKAHLAGSGLEGSGQYGFEMRDPVEGLEGRPHMTRSFQFPTEKQCVERAKRYLEINSHRILGQHDDVKWMDSGYEDTLVRERAIDKYKKIIRKTKKCPNDTEMLGDAQARDLQEDAIEKKAVECLVKDMRSGAVVLRTPPYPPEHPDGIVLDPKEYIIRRTVKGESREDIKNPPLYLPYKMGSDGKYRVSVKEGHLYKKYEQGDDPELTTGYGDNKYTKLSNNIDPSGKEIYKDAGIFFNHNTPKQLRLIRGTPEYEAAYAKIIASQPRAGYEVANNRGRVTTSGDMFRWVLEGVIDCINNPSCGGKTEHEITIMLRNVEEIYIFALDSVINQFDSNKFYLSKKDRKEGQSVFASPKDIKAEVWKIAHNATNSISQKAHSVGGGGRRRRSYEDPIRQEREETPLFQTRIAHTADYNHFPYSPENSINLLKDLAELNARAAEADKVVENAKRKRADTVRSKVDYEFLNNLINKETAVVEDIVTILASFFRSANRLDQKIAKENAESQVKEWEKDGLTTSQMIDAIKKLPVYNEIFKSANPTGQAIMPNRAAQSEKDKALEELRTDLAANKPDSPMIKSKYLPAFDPPHEKPEDQFGNYAKQLARELQQTYEPNEINFILVQVQDAINSALGKPTSKTVAARTTAPEPLDLTPKPVSNYYPIWRGEKTPQALADLTFNPYVAHYSFSNSITQLKRWVNDSKNKFTESDFKAIMDKLNALEAQKIKEEEED